MNILVLNGSPRPQGGTAAMVHAFAEGANNVYTYAEGIYHDYLHGYFRVKDCGVFEATTSRAKSPEMAEQLRAFGASL